MTYPGSTSTSFLLPRICSHPRRYPQSRGADELSGGAGGRPRGQLYFSDMFGNRIYRMTPAGELPIFRADSGRTNGNTFDAAGRLISCEGAEQGPGGRRRIVRTDLETGAVAVLTERYEGKRYNSPNDVCVDIAAGSGSPTLITGGPADPGEDAEAVYRIDPDGR